MTEGLSTKMLDVIANSGSTAKSKPWIPLMIEQLLEFGVTRGIYLPEHILLCNFKIQQIAKSGNKFDAFTVSALRDWASIGYTRKILGSTYEEIASLPIWLNPHLLIDGKPIPLMSGSKTTVPFGSIKRRSLYHIAQLFTNFNTDAYYYGHHVVLPGAFKSNAQLNQEYVSGGGSVLDSDWNKLKQAVLDKLTPEGVSWATICATGNQNLVAGQFLSTVEVKTNKNIRTPGTIYKVLPGGNITEHHRNLDTGVFQSLNISGAPGQESALPSSQSVLSNIYPGEGSHFWST